MKKVEELSKNIESMRRELIKLCREDERVYEIIRELDSFDISERAVKIRIFFSGGLMPIEGIFKEDESFYAFILMDFYCSLYYKCKKVIRRIRRKEYTTKIDKLLINMGRTIKKQVLQVKPNENFKTEDFYEEFKDFIDITIKSLGHIVDEIGHLTTRYEPREAKKLQKIREIYKKITFGDNTITYTDCITKKSKTVNVYDTIKLLYIVMCIYLKVYTESILWLKKYDSSEQWCPLTPWQAILKFNLIIQKYFL